MTAADIKALLHLKPHPREGGWFVRTWESPERIPAGAFADGRYGGDRRTSTAIYYLLEPDTFSEMHCLASDEIFHFYMGDPVEQLQLMPDGTGQVVILGNDLAQGHRPQVTVPQGVWQGARLQAGGRWALLGCTVSPGFEFEDYRSAGFSELEKQWPAWGAMLSHLTRS